MNHKKHLTTWFTTHNFRAINLALVQDVFVIREPGADTYAQVYETYPDGSSKPAIRISEEDAHKLFNLLV